MPDTKYARTYDRTELMQLSAYLAHAINQHHLINPQDIPVISIYGEAGTGKSLVAEAMLKSWMDDFSYEETVSIPPDEKMFMERYPMQASMTVSQVRTCNNRDITFAFNSNTLFDADDIKARLSRTFEKDKNSGIFIVSNANRHRYYADPESPVWLEIKKDPASSFLPKPFDDMLTITLFKEALLDDPQFAAYWSRLEDHFSNDQEKELARLRSLPAKTPPLPGRQKITFD